MLVAGLAPFSPATMGALLDIVSAFRKYLTDDDYQDAAQVTKERIRVFKKYGVPPDDIARMAASFNVALLANTAPTAFWTLFNVLSRPELLQEIRNELEEHAVTRNGESPPFELDIVAVKTKCPLLLAAFEETQRTLTTHAIIRKVLEDTTIDKYRLRKGNYVQIPNAPIHHNAELWGVDPTEFNPRRFIKDDDTAVSSSPPSNAFLAWGAAPHLCPARQFASTEILIMAALMFLRMEVEPVSGKWVRPAPNYGDLVTLLPPKKDFEVKIRPREGWTGDWSFKMGESKSRVPLASG
jgi:cytochrome P450